MNNGTASHYCPISNGTGSTRIAACGAKCTPAPSDWQTAAGFQSGTCRVTFIRCRKCVALLRQYVDRHAE
jgi:hypothetical protein